MLGFVKLRCYSEPMMKLCVGSGNESCCLKSVQKVTRRGVVVDELGRRGGRVTVGEDVWADTGGRVRSLAMKQSYFGLVSMG